MKGCISPQTPANKLPSPASALIPRAAVVADVVGGSWDDRRLRDDTFEQQDFCSWHRCLGVRREGLPCLGGLFVCGFCSQVYSAFWWPSQHVHVQKAPSHPDLTALVPTKWRVGSNQPFPPWVHLTNTHAIISHPDRWDQNMEICCVGVTGWWWWWRIDTSEKAPRW